MIDRRALASARNWQELGAHLWQQGKQENASGAYSVARGLYHQALNPALRCNCCGLLIGTHTDACDCDPALAKTLPPEES